MEGIVYLEGRGHERLQTLSCVVPSWGKAPGYDSFPWFVKRLREHWGYAGTSEPRTYKMKTRSEMIKLRIFLAYAGIKGDLREMECPRLDGREARSSLFHIWTISPKYGQF